MGKLNPTITVAAPKGQEFGRAIVASKALMSDEQAVQTAYQMVIADFFKAKNESFPNWDGLPEIKVGPGTDMLRREISIGWYAIVDNVDIVNLDDEEELWDN